MSVYMVAGLIGLGAYALGVVLFLIWWTGRGPSQAVRNHEDYLDYARRAYRADARAASDRRADRKWENR